MSAERQNSHNPSTEPKPTSRLRDRYLDISDKIILGYDEITASIGRSIHHHPGCFTGPLVIAASGIAAYLFTTECHIISPPR